MDVQVEGDASCTFRKMSDSCGTFVSRESVAFLLPSKVLANHRQTLQWEILLHEISGEDEDEYRVDEAGDSTGEVLVSLAHSQRNG